MSKGPKPIKPYRSHYEKYRTWMGAIGMVIQILTMLKVFGVL